MFHKSSFQARGVVFAKQLRAGKYQTIFIFTFVEGNYYMQSY